MPITWDELQLYHVDLHLHAGTERPEAYSVRDFIEHALATGRRIIGITDHWGRFLGRSKKRLNHYPGTLEGFRQFAAETHAAGAAHPEAIILFGPEMGFDHLWSETGDAAFGVPEVTFFLGEPGGYPPEGMYGEYLIRGVEAIARARDRHGRPGILSHPLRAAINRYVGKSGPGPAHPHHPPLPPLGSLADPRTHTERLLDIDIAALAEASLRHDVPLELNESSWGRILGMNHQSFAERYLFFYRALLDEGARVTLGSDQHDAEHGASTAFIPAMILGLKPRDMTFLRHWLGA